MSFPRLAFPVLAVAICVALLATLLPAAALAAPERKPREYMVTLRVADSGRLIKPANRASKTRIRQRAKLAGEATDRLRRAHGIKLRHRYGNAVTGFSAAMTPAQAEAVAADPDVVAIRPARTFEIAAEQVPVGIERVKAWTEGTTPGPDIDVNVAVLDTGIGPSKVGTSDERTGEPIAMQGVNGKPAELNIRGGVNCYDDPWTGVNEAVQNPGFWGDTHGHGTHLSLIHI